MKTVGFAVLALAAGLLLPGRALSQTITCEPGAAPLLEVLNFSAAGIGRPPSETRSALVLCKDRRLIFWSTQTLPVSGGSPTLPPFPFGATLQVGTVSPDSFSQLQAAMLAAQIGQLTDCTTSVSPFERTSLQVSWFGSGTRENTFKLGAIGDGAACSTSAHELFLAILTLQFGPQPSTIILQ